MLSPLPESREIGAWFRENYNHLQEVLRREKQPMRKIIITGTIIFLIPLALGHGCASSPQATAPVQPSISISIEPTPGQNSAEPATLSSITAQEAFNLIQKNKNNPGFVLLDVRTADEFEAEHLADAINIDYRSPDFKTNIDKLDRYKEYLIYCGVGARGGSATEIMIELGFGKVHNLTGGITAWIDAGYPTVKILNTKT
jgi:rhodanese-related sulfurtransferase